MSAELSEELPPRHVSRDVVLLARVLEAEAWPLPLMGLLDMTQISQSDFPAEEPPQTKASKQQTEP